MQLIEDGNYYFLIEILGRPKTFQWELAVISCGHIKWVNLLPRGISVKELVDNKTPMVKIPGADKLKSLLEQYKDNPR